MPVSVKAFSWSSVMLPPNFHWCAPRFQLIRSEKSNTLLARPRGSERGAPRFSYSPGADIDFRQTGIAGRVDSGVQADCCYIEAHVSRKRCFVVTRITEAGRVEQPR